MIWVSWQKKDGDRCLWHRLKGEVMFCTGHKPGGLAVVRQGGPPLLGRTCNICWRSTLSGKRWGYS